MKALILSLIATVFSVQAFAASIELSRMDVGAVADHINQMAKKVQIMTEFSEDIQNHEERMNLIGTFINSMHDEMKCTVNTSNNPMTFDCGFKKNGIAYTFIALGTLHMDNGQVVGLDLQDREITVYIVRE